MSYWMPFYTLVYASRRYLKNPGSCFKVEDQLHILFGEGCRSYAVAVKNGPKKPSSSLADFERSECRWYFEYPHGILYFKSEEDMAIAKLVLGEI